MTTHLISILGLPQKDGASGDRSYRRTVYRFPDGAEVTTTTFGLALAGWFGSRANLPIAFDRVLWLGTVQSAWGSLLQAVLGDGAVEEPIFLELFDTPVAMPEQASRLATVLSRATGKRHECRIIPPCADTLEQQDFVSLLSGELQPRDRVVLDLTHGLRNQSLMLAQSALMLEGAYGVTIEGMFYGGLEIPREKVAPAPAVDLTGFLVQARLAQALAAFRSTGDVRLLASHLPPGSFRTKMDGLGQAVAMNDMAQATRMAKAALSELEAANLGVLRGTVELALRAFRETLSGSQFTMARGCLDRGDWTRAITCLFEGAISEEARREGLRDDCFQGGRDLAKKALAGRSETFLALTHLRNQVAHGVVDPGHRRFHLPWWGAITRSELTAIGKDPEQLRLFLRRALQALQTEFQIPLPHQPGGG